jgi:hypothetical protein
MDTSMVDRLWEEEGTFAGRIIDLCKTLVEFGFFYLPNNFKNLFDALISM